MFLLIVIIYIFSSPTLLSLLLWFLPRFLHLLLCRYLLLRAILYFSPSLTVFLPLFFPSPQLFVVFPISGTEFELLEVCLGTPEGTDCPQVGRQVGDLRPSDIGSVLQDSTRNLCHIWLQDSREGAELLDWVWYCKTSCFSLLILHWDEIPQWSKNVNICHYVRPRLWVFQTLSLMSKLTTCIYSGEQFNHKVILRVGMSQSCFFLFIQIQSL